MQRADLWLRWRADERAAIPVAVASNTSSVILARPLPNKAAFKQNYPKAHLQNQNHIVNVSSLTNVLMGDIRNSYDEMPSERHNVLMIVPRKDDTTFGPPSSSGL